jgi:hypothetical protein
MILLYVCVCICILLIVARQQLGKHIPVATDTHAAIEEFLDASISVRSVSYEKNICVYILPVVARQRLDC